MDRFLNATLQERELTPAHFTGAICTVLFACAMRSQKIAPFSFLLRGC
jgi:hypothetical protein